MRARRGTATRGGVCYVIPEYRPDSYEHFAHIPNLLVALAKHCRVAALVERGEPPPLRGVDPVVVLTRGRGLGVRRLLAYVRAVCEMRAAGFDTYFLRYSRFAVVVLLMTRPLFHHRVFFWSSGQADMPDPDGRGAGVRTRLKLMLNRWMLRSVDRVVTGPESMVAYMSARWGVPGDRISLLYNDVDVDRFSPVDDETRAALRKRLGWEDSWVVLFVHRIAVRRGSRLLIPLAEQLRERGLDDVRLVVVGTGPDEPRLEREVAVSSAGDAIELAGAVANCDLPDWYRAADCFLMPSYEEGFPRVLVEAMACEVPLVTTRAGGSPDIVGEDYPFLVDVGDGPALADAVMHLHATGISELATLGHDLRSRVVERYSTESVAEMLAHLLS